MLIVKGGQVLPKAEIIETPSYGLNRILGGGFWSGRYHILWGNPQAGKSTFALHTARMAQELGFVPVIVDAEGSMTDEWMEHCGVNLADRIVMRSTIAEEILQEMMPMLRSKNEKYIFIVDSINSIVMESFYKKDDGSGGMGIYARSQGHFLQKVSSELISGVNHCVLFIAQQTMGMKGTYFVAQGKFGNAAHHWATNIIKLNATDSKDNTERDDDEKITNRMVTWKIDKSKQSPIQGTKGDYWFSPDTASIDIDREVFHIAVRNGIISRGGAWFTFGDRKYQGENRFVNAMVDDGFTEEIIDALNNVVKLDYDWEEEEK
jgi:recombination protein RecA